MENWENPLRNPSDPLHGQAVEVFQRERKPLTADHIIFKYRPPTFSKITENLWIGGAPSPRAKVGEFFDCLVLCAREYQVPDCFQDIQVALAPMHDNGLSITKKEMVTAVKAAGKVAGWIDSGLKVLVTCYSGLNRSGLVIALALCNCSLKLSPDEAVTLIRKNRGPDALSNSAFVKFLYFLAS